MLSLFLSCAIWAHWGASLGNSLLPPSLPNTLSQSVSMTNVLPGALSGGGLTPLTGKVENSPSIKIIMSLQTAGRYTISNSCDLFTLWDKSVYNGGEKLGAQPREGYQWKASSVGSSRWQPSPHQYLQDVVSVWFGGVLLAIAVLLLGSLAWGDSVCVSRSLCWKFQLIVSTRLPWSTSVWCFEHLIQ